MFFRKNKAKLTNSETTNKDLIRPEEIIKKYTIEEFCESSEKYWAEIPILGQEHVNIQMAKPYMGSLECSFSLIQLGLLINGMKLAPTMVVLDFGAGSCWFSKILNQLHCSTISLDTSSTALEIGKQSFNEYPIVGKCIKKPIFLKFNGHNIDLEDESVDRIISFDAFHHVPNQQTILKEFYRILKPGGIFGFNEPGKDHSKTNRSQYEMKNFKVLENDIDIEKISKITNELGFSEPYFKLYSEPYLDITLPQYLELINNNIPPFINNHIVSSMKNTLSCFFVKGKYVSDSRINYSLMSKINVLNNDIEVNSDQPFCLNVEITNIGEAIWLKENIEEYGVVKLGVHLYNENKDLIKLSYMRYNLHSEVQPQQKIDMKVELVLHEKGNFILSLDLVSEKVAWFEQANEKNSVFDIKVKCI